MHDKLANLTKVRRSIHMAHRCATYDLETSYSAMDPNAEQQITCISVALRNLMEEHIGESMHSESFFVSLQKECVMESGIRIQITLIRNT